MEKIVTINVDGATVIIDMTTYQLLKEEDLHLYLFGNYILVNKYSSYYGAKDKARWHQLCRR